MIDIDRAIFQGEPPIFHQYSMNVPFLLDSHASFLKGDGLVETRNEFCACL